MTEHDPWAQHLTYQPEHSTPTARRGRTQRGRALPVLAAAAALLLGVAGGYALRLATEPEPAPAAATVAGCTVFLSSQLRMTLIQADGPDAWSNMNDQVINAWRLNPTPECKGLSKAQSDEAGRAAMTVIGPDAARRIQEWAAAATS